MRRLRSEDCRTHPRTGAGNANRSGLITMIANLGARKEVWQPSAGNLKMRLFSDQHYRVVPVGSRDPYSPAASNLPHAVYSATIRSSASSVRRCPAPLATFSSP